MLTVRARSRHELAEELDRRSVPKDAATSVLDRLTQVGLIDDVAFARGFVETRVRERGLAAREIERQLRTKGIDGDTAEAALTEVNPSAERETALRLVRKRQRALANLDTATQTRRLAGLLARKGYSAGLTYSVVREVVGEAGLHGTADEDAGLG
ncbi:recombination regulator RecX [Jatrophihabitans telluris]|uniref:Regulatory protein RecX n=1 Tax=Jatrophihabitans telluris TaxID=2038343 RepID=A0ABY4QV50_9ACTN|nr:regulatory protein RecX [Jatrophihabitans telluris]UQX86746.1 recombination regulator RecX [Jatrophihabitans telluris]